MTFIPTLPRGATATIVGTLFSSEDPDDLAEDMLDVEFPSGVQVSAGWKPDGADGSYYVSVTHGFRHLVPVFRTRDFAEASARIQSLISRFGSGEMVQLSDAESIQRKWTMPQSAYDDHVVVT